MLPGPSASEVITLWRYTIYNLFIIIIIIMLQVGSRIKSAVQQLGTGCIELVQDAGSLQMNPTASIARRDLGVHARKVLENVPNAFLCSPFNN